jgi:hypothetical protein
VKAFTILTLIFATVAITRGARAAIVYDNSANSLAQTYGLPNVEFGDQITLAGDARVLTDFKVEYFLGATAADVFLQLNLYANDGPLVTVSKIDGSTERIPTPGTHFYASGLAKVWQGWAVADVSGLAVEAPATFTWTVTIFSTDPAVDCGLALSNPPTVGSSSEGLWQKTGGLWEHKLLTDPPLRANFAARVAATVKPLSVARAGKSEVLVTAANGDTSKALQRGPTLQGPWSTWQVVPARTTPDETVTYSTAPSVTAEFFKISP